MRVPTASPGPASHAGHATLVPHAYVGGGKHGGYYMVPMQYTNTFTREAVPGNASVAHASMQTDLCGHSWPLDQPLPVPAYLHQPHTQLPHMHAPHVPAALGLQTQRSMPTGFNSCSLPPLAHAGSGVVAPGACTTDLASANCAPEQLRHDLTPTQPAAAPACAAPPPSPPAAPPPDVFGDLLFDFDKFDAEDERLSLGSARSISAKDDDDFDAVLDFMAGPGANAAEDTFKVLARDPDDGRTTLTAHIHQPDYGLDAWGQRFNEQPAAHTVAAASGGHVGTAAFRGASRSGAM
jgi:hypothetical protein